jgi:alpha-tubulin suppressor-like RCC1 family protein
MTRGLLGSALVIVVAWGGPMKDSSVEFASVSTGFEVTCATTTDGTAYCWGDNGLRTLGSDSSAERCAEYLAQPRNQWNVPCSSAPLRVEGAPPFSTVKVGLQFTCGLTLTGAAYRWGRRNFGGGGIPGTLPIPVAAPDSFVSMAANGVLCALVESGTAYCAGGRGFDKPLLGRAAELPDGPELEQFRPVAGNVAFRELAVARDYVCGLSRDARSYCWGNFKGWGIAGNVMWSGVPVLVDAPDLASLSAGDVHVCGLTADGTAYCWGMGSRGELGGGRTPERSDRPVLVDKALRFHSISAGGLNGDHTCALTADGTAYCWGRNAHGALGTGGIDDKCRPGVECSSTPRPVAGGLHFKSISAGGTHTCAITIDGKLYCWGDNGSGELGVPRSGEKCGSGPNAVPCSRIPVRVSLARR